MGCMDFLDKKLGRTERPPLFVFMEFMRYTSNSTNDCFYIVKYHQRTLLL